MKAEDLEKMMGEKSMKCNLAFKILSLIILSFLLTQTIPIKASNYQRDIYSIIFKNQKDSLKCITIALDNVNKGDDLSSDLKIKKADGSWEDHHVTANVGSILEFKIIVNSSKEYPGVLILIELPTINDNPMFNYINDSASPIPGLLEGHFEASDTEIIWIWYLINEFWSKEMTFKAKIVQSGMSTVKLTVLGLIDIDHYDYANDSVEVTGKSCCFPAGTKITMADGSKKNIEDVKIGDSVLSYNPTLKKYSSWTVKNLGSPVHEVLDINNGLLRLTCDHPIYLKKKNSRVGWGAIDPTLATNACRLRKTILPVEVGDSVLKSNNRWVEITTIAHSAGIVQTYNIVSYTGKHTYFANDVLVFEEYPRFWTVNVFWEKLIERFPILEKFLNRSS
jgi:hypothetical protein